MLFRSRWSFVIKWELDQSLNIFMLCQLLHSLNIVHEIIAYGRFFLATTLFCCQVTFCWFWPRRLACAMRAQCVAWPLLLPSFSLSSSFSQSFAFDPLRGNSYVWKFFPPIFWPKKIGNFYFFTKKTDFLLSLDFFWPAFGHGRLGHPQSLEYS